MHNHSYLDEQNNENSMRIRYTKRACITLLNEEMYVNRYQFYQEIILGKKPIKDIFTSLSGSMRADDFDELFNEFAAKLHEDFISYYEKNEVVYVAIGGIRLPRKIYSRVRLAILLLSLCALGATFDENLYSYSMDFVLKKELSITPISLN